MGEVAKVLDLQDYLELPLGAVIYGKVTVDGVKKDVICRADEINTPKTNHSKKTDISHTDKKDDPPKTAKYFLYKMQTFLNGGKETIGEEGVEVEKIDFPDRAQTLKIVGGRGWSVLDENSEDSANQTPRFVGRMIDYCRSGLEKFFGV